MDGLLQVVGVDAVGLINQIGTAARRATTHRKNCQHLADHVRMIGKLLVKLESTDLRSFPATAEPLDRMEEALRKALDLVESCRDKSYLYLLAMGWSLVYQFRQVQNEIDRYLKLVPLISLVHAYRLQNLRDSLKAIEEDQREYTLDEEDMEAQGIILKRDRTKKDADILEKSLSRRYPELQFHEALEEEKEKLHVELNLQRSQVNNDSKQCRVIEHLIEVTKDVVNVPPEKNVSLIADTCSGSQHGRTIKSNHGDNGLTPEDQEKSEWQADLFDCFSEPCLCLKACVYPCGIFTRIAHVVSNGKLTREIACNNLMAYSVFCGCFCYTCCVRRKLRKIYNIEGGSCDDFLTHLLCCCCAMVQEWHELELRGHEGCQGRKMIPPPYQYMKP